METSCKNFFWSCIFLKYILVCSCCNCYYFYSNLQYNWFKSSKWRDVFIYLFRYVSEARTIHPFGDMMRHIEMLDKYVMVIGEDEIVDDFVKQMDYRYPGI